MLPINENLQQGRYRIINQLGQNGTGLVYEAYDNVSETNVVLREITVKLNKVTTPAQLETLKLAFSEEAKVLTGIKHSSFIRVHDYFSEIDRHYLVLEAVDGEYLSGLLEQNNGAFPLSDVTDWGDQLLDALNYLHTQNPAIIHRDIKPQNIKVASDGRIKLLALAAARNSETAANTSISNLAFEATSLNYLPLEQIWGKLDLASQKVISNSYDERSEELLMEPPDARSDIYALGATLYHLVTARRPVDSLERSIDILEGKPDPLPSPSRLNPDIPPEISYVLMKALEIKREKRFESALIMRQVLKTAALRAKEREAQEAKKQPVIAAPEIRLPEPKQLEHDRPPVAQSAPEAETDPQQQLELIKARLLEAENKRLQAEQRAAEAERRLRENEAKPRPRETTTPDVHAYHEEAQLLDLPNVLHATADQPRPEEDPSQVLDLSHAPVKTEQPLAAVPPAAVAHSSESFEFSYDEAPKDRKVLWRTLALTAGLLVVCGAVFGVWSFLSSNTAGPDRSIQSPAMSLTDSAKPEPTAESAPSTTTETTAQTNTAAVDAATPGLAETAAGQPAVKTKAAPTPAKKQDIAAAKPSPAKQKKTVTVDDLINDN
jgi:serine/threonine protein kinase